MCNTTSENSRRDRRSGSVLKPQEPFYFCSCFYRRRQPQNERKPKPHECFWCHQNTRAYLRCTAAQQRRKHASQLSANDSHAALRWQAGFRWSAVHTLATCLRQARSPHHQYHPEMLPVRAQTWCDVKVPPVWSNMYPVAWSIYCINLKTLLKHLTDSKTIRSRFYRQFWFIRIWTPLRAL